MGKRQKKSKSKDLNYIINSTTEDKENANTNEANFSFDHVESKIDVSDKPQTHYLPDTNKRQNVSDYRKLIEEATCNRKQLRNKSRISYAVTQAIQDNYLNSLERFSEISSKQVRTHSVLMGSKANFSGKQDRLGHIEPDTPWPRELISEWINWSSAEPYKIEFLAKEDIEGDIGSSHS